jgi:hypothetical protein
MMPRAASLLPPQGSLLAPEDGAIEKIKQKRRESAQRSRARKNCYVHQLEVSRRPRPCTHPLLSAGRRPRARRAGG